VGHASARGRWAAARGGPSQGRALGWVQRVARVGERGGERTCVSRVGRGRGAIVGLVGRRVG
jgi:hypothetical protein